MENLPQTSMENPYPKSETKLSITPIGKILDCVMIANASRPNNFDVLAPKDWKWICQSIKADFPELTIGELAKIIINGTKGKYNQNQFTINAFTIYKWIEKYLENKPIKNLPCPEKYPDKQLWQWLDQRAQKKWLLENPENQIVKK